VNTLRIDAEVRRIENRPVHHVGVAAQLTCHVFRCTEHGPLLDHRIPRGDHAGHIAAGQGFSGRDAPGGELSVGEECVVALRRGVEADLSRGVPARGARIGAGRGHDLRGHPQL
jgi:hypothetical protein